MERVIKIDYAPNTIFITGEIRNAELKVINSRGTSTNKYSVLSGVQSHCQKCKERISSILN